MDSSLSYRRALPPRLCEVLAAVQCAAQSFSWKETVLPASGCECSSVSTFCVCFICVYYRQKIHHFKLPVALCIHVFLVYKKV